MIFNEIKKAVQSALDFLHPIIDSKEPKTFKGTTAEWNALTPAEQAVYEVKYITDDSELPTLETTVVTTIGDTDYFDSVHLVFKKAGPIVFVQGEIHVAQAFTSGTHKTICQLPYDVAGIAIAPLCSHSTSIFQQINPKVEAENSSLYIEYVEGVTWVRIAGVYMTSY